VANEIAFMIIMSMIALAGLSMVWWIRKQEHKEEHK
jgi:hypothetical protein